MPQVRKPEVDARIQSAALRCFASTGFGHTSMASIAAAADMAPANLYRYYPDGKRELFETVVPEEVARQHDALIEQRVSALLLPTDEGGTPGPEAEQLLAFWIAHRLEVVILLDRAGGTRFEGYGERFVERLVGLAIDRLRADGAEPGPLERQLLEVVFDNTRRAIVALLSEVENPVQVRRAVQGFWSYQLPGLGGLHEWILAQRAGGPSPREGGDHLQREDGGAKAAGKR
ncbi:TetR/AcrR family transcriptional regulator [Egibacter rhizosphaerae]|uniref:TetR/AcrR family transcriptional regulator n=1 Tax=Egibacter rhizosphaerae TaxID=1670831 RepID=A0A411YEF4_9ACTN|nr:TetR family transcriptional regulator [Egibacter rhizosphaerae]QBI19570.1 TetR/AcrR family transcriptional regulator [Egibacter rhizosphaerae]